MASLGSQKLHNLHISLSMNCGFFAILILGRRTRECAVLYSRPALWEGKELGSARQSAHPPNVYFSLIILMSLRQFFQCPSPSRIVHSLQPNETAHIDQERRLPSSCNAESAFSSSLSSMLNQHSQVSSTISSKFATFSRSDFQARRGSRFCLDRVKSWVLSGPLNRTYFP